MGEARYEAGAPVGEDFTITAGDGLMLYVNKAKTYEFTSIECPVWNLRTGVNLLGSPCASSTMTAYQIMTALGGESFVSSMQRFNNVSGQFEAASYANGQPAGVDFPIKAGEGYIIHMKQDVLEIIFCTDDDGDGYATEGGSCGEVDCDDGDATINPGATEICDYIDNNCDGLIDNAEAYVCTGGGGI